ncbi:hypothetical protein [Gottfriedia acidiceleris]|uniref:Ger(x)C family spore germination protein n=1 Tax=Gottfriedia acidiceleris TaxID=371036 RepID=UPI002FFDBA70
MKKTGIILYIVLLLPLLTSCWDQLPLSNLKLLDVAGFNLNDSGEVEIHSLETNLKSDGLGNGEQKSVITVETGPSLLKATAKNGLTSRVYYGADTRIYLLSEKFALEYPVSDLTFLLDAPYASIHSPVAILEGNLPKYLKDNLKNNEKFTTELNDYILTLEKRRLIPRVSMMDLILS